MDERMCYIYGLYDPVTDELRYIGKTNDLSKRLYRHMLDAERLSSHRANWLKSLKKQGLRPSIKIVEEVPLSQWEERERYWIRHFKDQGCPLVNCTDGGQGTTNPPATSRLTMGGNKQKTHCPKGHPYSGDNLRLTPDGRRVCKSCTNACSRELAKSPEYKERDRQWREKNREKIREQSRIAERKRKEKKRELERLLGIEKPPRRYTRKDYKHSQETKRKIGIGNKGKQRSIEHRESLRRRWLGQKGPHSRLSSDQVIEIRTLLQEGKSMESIGQEFGVHPSTIRNIKIGKSWKHLN